MIHLVQELNADSLKHAMTLLVINENLPFTHIESESLLNVVKLLNPLGVELMVKADALCDHVMRLYFQVRTEVKQLMEEDVENLNCTCDVWTSPTNDPIFALTGHWTSKTDGKLKVTLSSYKVKTN
jgi:hypothetical protein